MGKVREWAETTLTGRHPTAMTAFTATDPIAAEVRRTISPAMTGDAEHCARKPDSFYADLPTRGDFSDVARPECFADLPDDWRVVVADVEGSTAAVRAGRYKDVNLLGASCIISVLNAVRPVQIPYIFGGDGASLCVPPSQVDAACQALRGAQRMASEEFDLRLRVGVVPVARIRAAGHRVRVAKFRASDNYVQASFGGGGVQWAERCVKDKIEGAEFRIESGSESPAGDFSGLECRWDSIPGPQGEIVTLLVQATTGDDVRNGRVYEGVIRAIDDIYGRGGALSPVREADLRLTLEPAKLMGEARIHAAGKSRLRQAIYARWAQVQSIVGRVLLAKGLTFGGVDWGKYRRDVIANTDYRKFDDVLRHVLSGSAQQREELTTALEQRFRAGELVFGVHHSPAALMTCLIFARDGGHVHFVDGADGGYTMAAADLKQRLASGRPRNV